MKRLCLFGLFETTLLFHKKYLEQIFGNSVEISYIAFSESAQKTVNADVMICTSDSFFEQAKRFMGKDAPLLFADYTLEKEVIQRVHEMSQLGLISVVGAGYRIATTRKLLLESLGIETQRLSLWYNEMDPAVLKQNAVVFSNIEIPDAHSRNIIQIPHRYLSVNVIVQTALLLDRADIFSSDVFLKYCDRMCIYTQPVSNDPYGFLFDPMAKGTLSFTKDYNIIMCDQYIAEVVGIPTGMLVEQKAYTIFPFLKQYIESGRLNEYQQKIEHIKGKNYIVTISFSAVQSTGIGFLHIEDYGLAEKRQNELRRQMTHRNHQAKYSLSDIVGNSSSISNCKMIALKAATSTASVLIMGDTGTGKELFAQAIHNASNRSKKPFVAVNCGAIPESLLESELFGYEKGAFTGANKDGRQGCFELADKGTLFLDEVGNMPLSFQIKLLRVLQEKEVVRVGGTQIIPIDVRIIAATNSDLYEMVKNNTFRADLFYRLNVLSLTLPPLKQRKEDVTDLIYFFMKKRNYSYIISPTAMQRIIAYDFPGNIRELQNCVEYMSSLGVTYIEEDHLPPYLTRAIREKNADNQAVPQAMSESDPTSDYQMVLSAIASINRMGIGAGRRSVKQYLLNQEVFISERRLRDVLAHMKSQGLIEIYTGRRGMELTRKGIAFLSNK